ncbi:MAG TPA: hypothetical protein DCL21_01975 [Alphaproteobacteria bacterium]|nr:hypothetical protein [Alphaproteobacteria bacterium]
MKDKLNSCINLLTKAKELVCSDEPNVDLALDMLEKSQEILEEFSQIDDAEKGQYKEDLIQIQALGQIINTKLAAEKTKLQQKIVHSNKMTNAVRGYTKS